MVRGSRTFLHPNNYSLALCVAAKRYLLGVSHPTDSTDVDQALLCYGDLGPTSVNQLRRALRLNLERTLEPVPELSYTMLSQSVSLLSLDG